MSRRFLGKVGDINPRAVFDRILSVAGSSDTEGSTSSTSAVDIVTISGLTIPKTSALLIYASIAKTATHASSASVGLGVNGGAVSAVTIWSATTAAIDVGVIVYFIGGHDTTYTAPGLFLFSSAVLETVASESLNATLPDGNITSVEIRGLVVNATNSMTVNYVRVYELLGA